MLNVATLDLYYAREYASDTLSAGARSLECHHSQGRAGPGPMPRLSSVREYEELSEPNSQERHVLFCSTNGKCGKMLVGFYLSFPLRPSSTNDCEVSPMHLVAAVCYTAQEK